MIKTELFGDVGVIIVGAAHVGSIKMTVSPGQRVQKGDELGYFAYGEFLIRWNLLLLCFLSYFHSFFGVSISFLFSVLDVSLFALDEEGDSV